MGESSSKSSKISKVSCLYSLDKTFLAAKYLNRNFTKSDILDPMIFDFNELCHYLHLVGRDTYYTKIVLLIHAGINIVKNNEKFTLRLFNNNIVKICDCVNNTNYEMSYDCLKKAFYLKIDYVDKTYEFPNLSKVEMYFDSKKSRWNHIKNVK